MSNESILVLIILVNVVYFGYTRVWMRHANRWKEGQNARLKEAAAELTEKINQHNVNVDKLSSDLHARGLAKEKELFKIAIQQNKQMRELCIYVVHTITYIPPGENDASDKIATLAQLQEYIDNLQERIERDELHLLEISK